MISDSPWEEKQFDMSLSILILLEHIWFYQSTNLPEHISGNRSTKKFFGATRRKNVLCINLCYNTPLVTWKNLSWEQEKKIPPAHILACFPTIKHAKGRTIAELGNWNTPLDIIELENDGKRFVLLANSSRALMKLKVNDIESFGDSLTERVVERSGTAGVDFIALPFVRGEVLILPA